MFAKIGSLFGKSSKPQGFEHVRDVLARHQCNDTWHFDTECIEDHGDYRCIAEQMRDLAQGSLPIENIRDYVDVEAGAAWLEFEFRGELIHVDFTVDNDWVDPSVFDTFVRLLADTDANKIFLFVGPFGQDCIIACTTKEQFERLKTAGVKCEPLASGHI